MKAVLKNIQGEKQRRPVMGSLFLYAHWREYRLTVSSLNIESEKYIWQICSYVYVKGYQFVIRSKRERLDAT